MVVVTGCSGGGVQWWSLLQVALVVVLSEGHNSCVLGSGGQWWSLSQAALVMGVSGGHCYTLFW